MQATNKRSSGILLPVFSLPSPFGIGDFGPEARNFADLLARCSQKYWQMLPLSPVDSHGLYSPYSSFSSMAGNTLFISPQDLAADGFLTDKDLKKYTVDVKSHIDYKKAERFKQEIFAKAWVNFKANGASAMKAAFGTFCTTEAVWLDDYALFMELKQFHGGKPWHQWPDEFKRKKQEALAAFVPGKEDSIEKTKWLQFIFNRQWTALKSYCNQKNIALFGDLPFYVSYDAVDVWSHPDIFNLDEKLNIKGMAGVPPDYFNSNGQLWGMPVFHWDVLKKQNYQWWVERIGKNIALFDVLRLDHFRAFASYWDVPGKEKTAINGKWIKGPGADFFDVLLKKFKKLPFVAEDLGDIDADVYLLRDEFRFPGMKVIQFAFGDDIAVSPHIPHNYSENYFAYTGTHDNNTVKGWYRQEMKKAGRNNIDQYTGIKVKEKTVAHIFIRLVLASVADTAIFPIQDLLNMDETARMNIPATNKNWLWRIKKDELAAVNEKELAAWVKLFNRA